MCPSLRPGTLVYPLSKSSAGSIVAGCYWEEGQGVRYLKEDRQTQWGGGRQEFTREEGSRCTGCQRKGVEDPTWRKEKGAEAGVLF